MPNVKRSILLFLILGFGGGGDHHHVHDRHPTQSKVRKWSMLLHKFSNLEMHS